MLGGRGLRVTVSPRDRLQRRVRMRIGSRERGERFGPDVFVGKPINADKLRIAFRQRAGLVEANGVDPGQRLHGR